MRRKQRNKKLIIVAILLLMVISIGYAAISTTLTINGTASIAKTSWNVHFENVVVTEGSVGLDKPEESEETPAKPTLSENDTKIIYNVTLEKPGDFYEFTVDVVNGGTINAKIAKDGVQNTELSETEAKYAKYAVTYADDTEIKAEDKLAKSGTVGEDGTKEDTKTVKVRVEYRDDIDVETLNALEGDLTLNLTCSLNYVQD